MSTYNQVDLPDGRHFELWVSDLEIEAYSAGIVIFPFNYENNPEDRKSIGMYVFEVPDVPSEPVHFTTTQFLGNKHKAPEHPKSEPSSKEEIKEYRQFLQELIGSGRLKPGTVEFLTEGLERYDRENKNLKKGRSAS